MKKHLIAAAVAGALAVPAMAQVEIYGVLDVGMSSVETKTGATSNKVESSGAEGQLSGNRLGFRGQEDLGNGLKAGFVLEMSHTPTEASSGVGSTNRQSFVSLSGGFGEIAIGRFNTLTKSINDSGTFAGASFAPGNLAGVNGYRAERLSNAIQYKTPNFSGITASIQFTNESSNDSSLGGKNKLSGNYLGLNYNGGPLTAAFARKDVDVEIEGINLDDVLESLIGEDLAAAIIADTGSLGTIAAEGKAETIQNAVLVTYDMGVARIFLGYQDEELEVAGVSGKRERDDMNIGVRIPLGATTLMAQYDDGEQKTAAGAKTDLKGFQLGAMYALSKRTTAYVLYGDEERKPTTGNKTDRDGFAIGIRHSF
jgi:predicted porin